MVSKRDRSPGGKGVRLWLIRHGQASFGQAEYDRLSRLGMRQSRILGAHFARAGRRFDAVYCGEMRRQSDTARLVVAQQPWPPLPAPRVLSNFNEYDFMAIIDDQLPGLIEELGLPADILAASQGDRTTFQQLFTTIYQRWVTGSHGSTAIESYRQYTRRIEEGLRTVVATSRPGQDIAIFTSGGVITAIIQMALALPDSTATELGWRISNTSVSLVTASAGPASSNDATVSCRLMNFNSTAHLDLSGDPGLTTYR